MSLPFFSADDVTSAVSMQEAIDAMEVAFSSVNNNTAESPLRITMPIGDHDAHHLSMPAYIHGGKYLTIKLINVHTKNPTMGYDLINGVIVIMDAKTGSATALIDGKSVTSLRTGAASGYATRILAKNDATHAVVFGNGVQAKTQIEAIQIVRDIKSIKVIGRDSKKVEQFCDIFDDTVSLGTINDLKNADIVCTATTSQVPLFEFNDISNGAHVNAVGAHGPNKREVPTELIQKSKVFVDSLSSSYKEAGNILIPIENGDYNWDNVQCEIGELINVKTNGRSKESDITFFNSIGTAVQDLVISNIVMEKNIGAT